MACGKSTGPLPVAAVFLDVALYIEEPEKGTTSVAPKLSTLSRYVVVLTGGRERERERERKERERDVSKQSKQT